MVVDEFGDRAELAMVQPEILRQLDVRFKPELGLAVGTGDMDVWPPLFAGKEKEAETIGPAVVLHGDSCRSE
jgi:hypothetical protein